MVLEHYISELLYRYNCVTVPNFGAFLTQTKSAVINTATNAFYAPRKTVSFNEQVATNDGLLISYMADAEKVSYETMLTRVNEQAAIWKAKLQQGDRLKLNAIGELWLNESNKIQFQPENQVNYATSSFGLSSFVALPVTRETLKEEVESIEEKIPFIFTPERRSVSAIRPYFKYAALFLLTIATGFTAYSYVNNQTTALVQEEAQERVVKRIQEATFFDLKPVELPPLSIHVTTSLKKKTIRVHHVVAGAFKYRKNADRKIRQLKRRGFNASYIGTNKFGLHMVNYDSYTNVKEALNALKTIKQSQSREAWLLSTNK